MHFFIKAAYKKPRKNQFTLNSYEDFAAASRTSKNLSKISCLSLSYGCIINYRHFSEFQ